MSFVKRLLSPIVEVRDGEGRTALLMFAYSFLVMTAYNMVKPITRSAFIRDLGADNLPYVLLAAGMLIGVIMSGYAWLLSRVPRRWSLPITQGLMAGMLVIFWLLFQTGQQWVSVAFYVFGYGVLGILLISQFWTLANLLYDARQAKRLFGFIGGGAPLGGMTGSAIAVNAAAIGSTNLLLLSAGVLAVCVCLVILIIANEKRLEMPAPAADRQEEAVGGQEAVKLLRQSKHLQVIALVISFAAIGAAIIDQQLNMAAEASRGRADLDSLTAFLALVGVWMSGIGFFIQVWLTSRIHRFLGIGFALMILPVGLGATGIVMLLNAALWAPAMARILDQSLRYTVDKTTREILFLPLPNDLKLRAKAFVDVTVDRMAKALAALLLLVLVQPWGLALDWQRLSYASLGMMTLWLVMAVRARHGYLAAFRRSIERREMEPTTMRLGVADLSTVEALVEELAHADEHRVLYAIDVLESLDKRNLVTPLLLRHESAAVRSRALKALGAVRSDIAQQWLPAIQRLVSDTSPEVRIAAVGALASIQNADAAALVRPLLDDSDPRMVATAGMVLAGSDRDEDVAAAEEALSRLASDTRTTSAQTRKDVAAAIRHIGNRKCQHLLVPLLYDPDPDVADEAMRSVRALGANDFLFVPTLISLLRHRRLKSGARDVLVSHGEPVLAALGHFLSDQEEDIWVRRHIPATLARIPSQTSVDILIGCLEANEPDGFLRYKVVAALEKLRHGHDEFVFRHEPIEALMLKECRLYFGYLTLYYNLFERDRLNKDSLLARALSDKCGRAVDRIYRLLGLQYRWKDIFSARWAIEHGDSRARASALEYLDNVLSGTLRKLLMPVLEELSLTEKVSRGNVLLKTRPRDEEETLLHLINDDDQIVSACAISFVEKRKLWALVPDLEHVLEFRRAQDWFVFEAASWALAVYRMPEEKRRSVWFEPLPAVQLVARLHQAAALASVSINELFRIVGAGRQVRHEAGQEIFREGIVPDSLQVLLDGKVIAAPASRHGAREIVPPAPLAFEQVLEGRPMRETVQALDTSVTLALTSDELHTLLADNVHLVQGLFQTLAGRWATLDRLVVKGAAGEEVSRLAKVMTEESTMAGERLLLKGARGVEISRLAAGGLTPVQRVIVLGRIPIFARISAEELLHLAAITREVPLVAGETLVGEADPPSLCVVLSGELSLEAPSGAEPDVPPLSVGPGDAVGIFETLAGVPIGRRAQVVRNGVALHIAHEDLFDLLGHRPDLLRQLFGALFGFDATSDIATHAQS